MLRVIWSLSATQTVINVNRPGRGGKSDFLRDGLEGGVGKWQRRKEKENRTQSKDRKKRGQESEETEKIAAERN